MAVTLTPIKRKRITLSIKGTSPLITHKWSEKAKRMIREKKMGKKTKDREAVVPEDECDASTYYTENGDIGVPAMAIKSSFITAAHKDLGIDKTLVRKSLFIECDDKEMVLPMNFSGQPIMREDCVRVGMGSADLRYRPEFRDWSVELSLVFDGGNLNENDIVNLVNRAGFGVGIGEWRPEKGGEFGRYEVDTDTKMSVEEL